MKKTISLATFIFIFIITLQPVFAQQEQKPHLISENLEITELATNVYLHVSYYQTQNFGKVGANGLIIVENGQALMIDTPWDDTQTAELYYWVKNSLQATITTVIVTHWHQDCMGGLNYLDSMGVKSYANQMTIDIAEEKDLPIPQYGFTDSLKFYFQNIPIESYYYGAGHSSDNIVVWLPTKYILFGGCVIKDIDAANLGNLADANITAWPITLQKIMTHFYNARIIVPGHGAIGNHELIEHTLELLTN